MKLLNLKELLKRLGSYNYKEPAEYKRLFRDRDFIRLIGIIIVVYILISSVKGCIFKNKPKPARPKPVQTALAVKKDVPIYIDSFGNLASPEDVDIRSQVTGKIEEVYFTEGREVKTGSRLFRIDSSEYEAELKKAEASLKKNLADLKLKTDKLERSKVLAKKGLISQQDFEALKTEVEAASAAVDMDKASIELANININYCHITSPINGLTGKRQVDAGNIVTANNGPVLVNIKNTESLYVDFTISERMLSRVSAAKSKGSLSVDVMPEADETNKTEGELVFLDNAVDETTGTIFLRAVVENKERILLPGQFVTVRLILETRENATLAPYKGVRIGQKGHYLFVVTDENKAELRQLTVGMREGDYIIVEKGVKPGERIVTEGELGLAPGMPVLDLTQKRPAQKTKDKTAAGKKVK